MDTEHDQDALLRRATRSDVVETRNFGTFELQLLEGPTDNPIRLITHRGGRSFTFGVEGTGWKILSKIWRGDRLAAEGDAAGTRVGAYLIGLAQVYPEEFGVIED